MHPLTVHQLERAEIFRDIVRVVEKNRSPEGCAVPIKNGTICKITRQGSPKDCYVILRGYPPSGEESICMDEETRDKLEVKESQTYNFTFAKAGICGRLWWYWHTTDVGYRISAQIALIGLGLGILGLIFGIISLWK